MRAPKNFRVTARITGANKAFLEKHDVNAAEAIAKYCEIMANPRESLLAEKKLIENQLTLKKKEVFDIEMKLDDVNHKLAKLDNHKKKTVEDQCIESMSVILKDKGFCFNNQDEKIFNNIRVMDMMTNYAYKCGMDYDVFKAKVIENVLQ